MAGYELRKVYLPLAALDKCSECNSSKQVKLCSKCMEAAYCSPECQRKDWPKHKIACKRTDHIDLSTFYPFLACLAASCHIHLEKPKHPAITHKILNAPNPGDYSQRFPDGSAAKLIMLGEEIPLTEISSKTWWSTAISDSVRSKLFRRIANQGYALPIVMAVCISILAEIYTTTATPADVSPDKKERRRLRIRYRNSPISDFGVAWGSADVKSQDKFAFWDVENDIFWKGDDPNDHYWIYFKTVKGEEVTLDLSMYTFNFCMMVDSKPYREYCTPPFPFAPVFWRDRVISRNTPELHTERRRLSVLRNEELHLAIEHSDDAFRKKDVDLICAFMSRLSGGPLSALEKHLALVWSMDSCKQMEIMLRNQSWKRYPSEPPLAIETDPGELGGDEGQEDWFKFLKKWKKMKKGGATKESLAEAFRRWESKYDKK